MNNALFPHAAFIQFPITLGKPEENLKALHEGVSRLKPNPNTIIVLPELWATGFDYLHLTELSNETTTLLDSIQSIAHRHSVYFAGSLPERCTRDDGEYIYNTLYLTGPQGTLGKYRKNNLFSLWKENHYFTPGTTSNPIKTSFGDIGTLICFDIRFPLLAVKQAAAGARLLVVSSQWPTDRINHWRILLQARAIENQLYIAAANSCGQTGKFVMGGHSIIIAPDGTILEEADEGKSTGKAELNEKLIDEIRARFQTVALI